MYAEKCEKTTWFHQNAGIEDEFPSQRDDFQVSAVGYQVCGKHAQKKQDVT